MILLAGCQATLTGKVTDEGGHPLVGAVLDGGACGATTGAGGAFRTRCVPGPHRFVVRYPGHLDGEAVVELARLGTELPALTLFSWPATPGIYRAGPAGFVRLADTPLQRTSTSDGISWCTDVQGTTVPAGVVRLFDHHDQDWRALRLDEAGCAYRMAPSSGSYWTWKADRVEVRATEVAPGRSWAEMELVAGRYVLVPWHDGFLVRADVAADTWQAWGLVAG